MKVSYLIAAALALGAAAWVASGQWGDDATGPAGADTGEVAVAPSASEPAAEGPVTKVRAIRSQAEPVVQELMVMGQTFADRTVELRSELDGRVEAVLVDRGRRVAEGDPIVRLAPEARPANLAEARALVAQREREFNAAESLTSKGFNSDIRLAEAEALLEAARAARAQAEVAVDRLTITAPFDGVLETRPVEVGDFLSVADPVATIVDLDPLLVVAQVTERMVTDLTLGQLGQADLIDGQTLSGTVTYIAATTDAATRTFRVELSVPNPNGAAMAGQTARLRLPLKEERGHFVSPSALVLADDGTLGVKSVGDGNRVRFWPVSIVKDSADGVWLAGLPEEIGLIVLGHAFVVEGERVDPVWVTPQLARAE